MRTMLKVVIPTDTGNLGIKDGTLPKTIETLLQELHPESSYFYPENGKRTALFVFDMKDSTQLAEIGEKLWLNLKAEVSIFPVMNAQDLKTGLGKALGGHKVGAH